MMWRAPAHDMLISHVHVVSLLIRLIAGNSSPKLSLGLFRWRFANYFIIKNTCTF